MPLGLHADLKRRLCQATAEYLPSIRVMHRMFLDRSTTTGLLDVERSLPTSGPIQRQLKQYVGEFPFFNFITDSLSKELRERQKYDQSTDLLPLTAITGYEDPQKLAEYLVEQFDSLPWSYTFTVELPKSIGESIAKFVSGIELSDRISVVVPDERFREAFSLHSDIEDIRFAMGGGLLGFLRPPEWKDDTAYLQIKQCGYAEFYGESATMLTVQATLKAFFGIGIALRLFKVNRTYRATPTRSKLLIHRSRENGWVVERPHELESDISSLCDDLVVHDLDGTIKTDGDRFAFAQLVLQDISKIFQHNEKSEKILLASQWLFDSYCSKTELLSFVQTMVAMEILLGEKRTSDLMGLTELLSNRCAYLIGKTHEQRKQILSDFKEIYELRSRIVHAGEPRLTGADRARFRHLQWMCRRVIQEEAKLLKADVAETKKG